MQGGDKMKNIETKYKTLMTMNIILVILVLALGVYVLNFNGVFDKDVGLSPLDSTKILAYGTQNGSFTGAILNTIGTGKTLLCLTSGLSQNCIGKSGGDFVFSTGGGTSYQELAKINKEGIFFKNEILATKRDVSTVLSECSVVNVGVPAPSGIVQTGNQVCSNLGKKCVYNFIGFDPQATISGSTNKISQPISCGDATNNYPDASWARTTCC